MTQFDRNDRMRELAFQARYLRAKLDELTSYKVTQLSANGVQLLRDALSRIEQEQLELARMAIDPERKEPNA